MTEAYPKTVSTLPLKVAGAKVLAWAACKRIEGNYPGGMVLCRAADRQHASGLHEYITWRVYTKDGGETWEAYSGHYTDDLKDAWEDFTSRACMQLAEQ